MKYIISLLSLFIPIHCFALFNNYDSAARPAGMAYAFSAIATDLNAIKYNPSGLALLPYPELNFNYSMPYPNLNDGTLFNDQEFIVGYPISLYKEIDSDEAVPKFDFGTIGFVYRNTGVSGRYEEETITFSYARKVINNFFMGINVNQFKNKYSPGIFGVNAVDMQGNITQNPDPLFEKSKSASGTGIDAGVSYHLVIKRSEVVYDRYVFSLVGENIISPDLGLADEKIQPFRKIKLALGYNHTSFKIDLDYVRNKITEGITDNKYALGMERWFSLQDYGKTALRSGLSIGSKSSTLFAFGLSYLFKNYLLDYAYIIPMSGLKDIGNEHKISFTFRFGKVDSDLEPNPILRSRIQERQKLNKTIQQLNQQTAKQKQELRALRNELDSVKSVQYYKEGVKVPQYQELQNSYDSSLVVYKKMIEKSENYQDRRLFLENLIRDYKKTSIDVSLAIKELSIVTKMIEKGENDYKLSWAYYSRLVERGADLRERKRVLIGMKRKYNYLGIDLSTIDKELSRITKEKQ
ncbi:MAG: hypothetical protein ABII27_02260 [bacterium]